MELEHDAFKVLSSPPRSDLRGRELESGEKKKSPIDRSLLSTLTEPRVLACPIFEITAQKQFRKICSNSVA